MNYDVVDHKKAGCPLDKMKNTVLKYDKRDIRRPDCFLSGFVMDEDPPLFDSGSVEVLDIDCMSDPDDGNLWDS